MDPTGYLDVRNNNKARHNVYCVYKNHPQKRSHDSATTEREARKKCDKAIEEGAQHVEYYVYAKYQMVAAWVKSRAKPWWKQTFKTKSLKDG